MFICFIVAFVIVCMIFIVIHFIEPKEEKIDLGSTANCLKIHTESIALLHKIIENHMIVIKDNQERIIKLENKLK